MSETVIDIKTKKRRRHAPRDLVAIDKTSGPARYYDKMQRDIAADLGGRRLMSRIETELIKGFCGCATRLEYLNYQIMLGEAAEADVASYAQLASTMLRLGSKLGLSRRAKTVTTLGELIRADQAAERARLARERDQQIEGHHE
jgi:signal transduction histidine kinase